MERLLRQFSRPASDNSEFQSRSYEQLTRGLHPARQSRKVEVFGRPKNPAEAGTLNAVFETMTSLPRLTFPFKAKDSTYCTSDITVLISAGWESLD